jgi:hypothetical protein
VDERDAIAVARRQRQCLLDCPMRCVREIDGNGYVTKRLRRRRPAVSRNQQHGDGNLRCHTLGDGPETKPLDSAALVRAEDDYVRPECPCVEQDDLRRISALYALLKRDARTSGFPPEALVQRHPRAGVPAEWLARWDGVHDDELGAVTSTEHQRMFERVERGFGTIYADKDARERLHVCGLQFRWGLRPPTTLSRGKNGSPHGSTTRTTTHYQSISYEEGRSSIRNAALSK